MKCWTLNGIDQLEFRKITEHADQNLKGFPPVLDTL
jgi:hypothetical protein